MTTEREAKIVELRKAAIEIAAAGHAGWGNTCSDAADMLEADARQPTTLMLLLSRAMVRIKELEAQQVAVPQGLIEALREAAAFISAVNQGDEPATRYPLADELGGFALMIAAAPQPRNGDTL